MSSAPKTFNPLIDRIISSPLTFVAAKKTDTENDLEKPASYIVLSKRSKSRKIDPVDSNMVKSSPKASPKKPMSMAEAVAAYTGKKFMTKAEKKKLKRDAKPSFKLVDSDEGEDIGEIPEQQKTVDMNDVQLKDSDSDSQYESASEYHDADAGVVSKSTSSESLPFAEFRSESSVPLSSDDTKGEDEDDEDDEDDGDFDDDENEDEEDEEEDDISSDDLDKLKHDLISDTIAANQEEQDDTKDEATPPTSPEDEEKEAKKEGTAVEVKAESPVLTDFYTFNENPQDRGLNNSNRILKNWTKRYLNKKPVGLLNHGVTCYMNSAIQALIHVPALQHYLDDIHNGKYNKVLPNRSVSHVLSELSQRMWGLSEKERTPKYINPKKIIQRLDDINCMMSEWQQEDSHEYYMSLISRLQEDSTPKGVKLNQSIMYDIFGGLLNQAVTCQNCGHVSETKQEFYDLSLGFNRKRKMSVDSNEPTPASNESQPTKYSIEKSIKDFFSSEYIKADRKDKSSGYYCEKCKSRTVATKQSTIDISPETLTVHLKRFKFSGNSSLKVKQSISYPKYLDLTEYTSNGEEPVKYQLISVIVHEGRSISSGHYVSHCLQPNGSWSTYDDEYINKMNEREALNDPSAYFLIYTKLTPKKRKIEGEESARKRRRK